MLSFEDDEEGGESLEELTADGTPLPSTSADALNDNSQQAPTMVRLKSTDSDNNVENLSRRLDICWRDVYYDSSRDNEEKIYEDLCYITFSSTLPEVVVVLCVLPPDIYCVYSMRGHSLFLFSVLLISSTKSHLRMLRLLL